MRSLLIDREKIISFDAITKDIFLYWYPGEEDKWDAFVKIRHDWLSKYGTLKGVQYTSDNRAITFISKITWAFNFLDRIEEKRGSYRR